MWSAWISNIAGIRVHVEASFIFWQAQLMLLRYTDMHDFSKVTLSGVVGLLKTSMMNFRGMLLVDFDVTLSKTK